MLPESPRSLSPLQIVLRTIAPIFFLVSALHLIYGVGADAMLGAVLPGQAHGDPALDSQNRFYGVAFSLYGVLLLICSSDLTKYQNILRALFYVFLAAGAARLVSITTHGLPPLPVLVLLGSELIAPPIFLWWLNRDLRRESADPARL